MKKIYFFIINCSMLTFKSYLIIKTLVLQFPSLWIISIHFDSTWWIVKKESLAIINV